MRFPVQRRQPTTATTTSSSYGSDAGKGLIIYLHRAVVGSTQTALHTHNAKHCCPTESKSGVVGEAVNEGGWFSVSMGGWDGVAAGGRILIQ